MPRLAFIGAAALILAAGCADFPDLENAVSPALRGAGYPALLPMDSLVSSARDAGLSEPGAASGQEARRLAARMAALQRRAAAMHGVVIDARSRARLMAAVARHFPPRG